MAHETAIKGCLARFDWFLAHRDVFIMPISIHFRFHNSYRESQLNHDVTASFLAVCIRIFTTRVWRSLHFAG
ncbi:MAG TPA: hypothetical protein DCS30_04640 [Rhizobiales bacterium]|nr:hypothetical protein [Hyphomicrobiales bacterium]